MKENLREFGFEFWHNETELEKPILPKKRLTYPQPWKEYNLAKTQSKLFFLCLLNRAVNCLEIEDNYKGDGRYPHLISDMIKCMCIKVYSKSTSRKIISDLRLIHSYGHIVRVPHFNLISRYMSSQLITPYLEELIKITSEVLKDIETTAIPDATGFSTFNRSDWINVRTKYKQWKKYKKLHILTGAKSNIVISAIVTKGTKHECDLLHVLLEKAKHFKKVSIIPADAGYLSRANAELISNFGAEPFIMPKKNTREDLTRHNRRGTAWYKMIKTFKTNESFFKRQYSIRSNVESTMAMLKRNYLPYVFSKSDTGQINEVLTKIVCHNIDVITKSMFEYGVELGKLRLLNSDIVHPESHDV
jgi:hypothetical protein